MGKDTGISWTDHSFNSWIGCSEVGAPCDFCYARELDRRYQWGVPADQRIKGDAPHWGPGAPRHRTSPGYWRQPILWNQEAARRGVPVKVFCNSLSDVFDNEVDDAWRADLFALWRSTPWLRWIALTKRVPNVAKMLPSDWGNGYPNVGLVATTGDQAEFDRDAPRLLSIPAAWHGFSIEPQLGPVDIPAWLTAGTSSIWLITGGESAQRGAARADGKPIPDKPRPWNPEWAREIIAASFESEYVYAFVKQTGARPLGLPHPKDGAGADPAAWPEDLRVQEFPPELTR